MSIFNGTDKMLRTVKAYIDKTKNDLMENEQEKRCSNSPIKAKFCFIDDDCRTETYSVLKPIFDQRKAKFSLAAITDKIGDERHLTIEQLLEFQNEGFEILSHTKSHPHLNELSELQKTDEIKGSKEQLLKWGIEAKCLIYPYGERNDDVIKIARKYYSAACSVAKENKNDRPLLTYNLGRLGIGEGTTFEILKERIDYTIKKGNLCIFTTHIADTPTDILPLIGQAIDYILSQGYAIDTFSEAFRTHQNSLDYGDYTLTKKGDYFIVDAVGLVYTTFGNTKILDPGTLNLKNLINDFPKKCISTIFLRSFDNLEGSPENAEPGVLITNNITNDESGSYQEYVTYRTKNRYFRYWNASSKQWGDFSSSVIKTLKAKNTEAFSKKWNEYDKYNVTYEKIFSGTTGSPAGGGVLITNTIIPEWQFVYQEFHPVGKNEIWKRTIIDAENNFSEFVKI